MFERSHFKQNDRNDVYVQLYENTFMRIQDLFDYIIEVKYIDILPKDTYSI